MPVKNVKKKNIGHNRYFHALSFYPDVHFKSKLPDEEVVLILRAHPITQLSWVFNTFILLLLLLGSNFIAVYFLDIFKVLFLDLIMLVTIFNYAWSNFLKWFFNVGVVTTKRIIDVDFYSILVRETSGTRVDRVEDISANVSGYLGSLFNYGDVMVQTAGEETNLEFLRVPEPALVVKAINSVIRRE